MRVIISQGSTIQQQLTGLREKEEAIGSFEDRMHQVPFSSFSSSISISIFISIFIFISISFSISFSFSRCGWRSRGETTSCRPT
jgi:hypothetical protein